MPRTEVKYQGFVSSIHRLIPSFLFSAFYITEKCYGVGGQCFLFDLNRPWCIPFFTLIRDPESSVICHTSSYTAFSCGCSFPYTHIPESRHGTPCLVHTSHHWLLFTFIFWNSNMYLPFLQQHDISDMATMRCSISHTCFQEYLWPNLLDLTLFYWYFW